MVNIIERTQIDTRQPGDGTHCLWCVQYLRSEISEVHIKIPQSCTNPWNEKKLPEALERTGFWGVGMKQRPK